MRQCAAALLRRKKLQELALLSVRVEDEVDDDMIDPAVLEALSQDCSLCKEHVSTDGSDVVIPRRCFTSRGCETSWPEQHADHYTNLESNIALPCGAVGCSSIVRLLRPAEGGIAAVVDEGECLVDRAGVKFWQSGRAELDTMRLEAPHELLFETFDGESID